MLKKSKESIYQFISRMAKEHPGLPYIFQDEVIAGWRDVSYVLWDDKLPFTEKEKLAMDVTDIITDCVQEPASADKLHTILEENPVCLYLTKLTSRIRVLLSENLIDKDRLYSLGIKLATEGDFEEEVKLGMLILGFFENDLVRQIIKTLGYHSSFAIYALEASQNFKDYNEFTFEIAQNTVGYGRLAALIIFQPVLINQKKWMFQHGVVNEVAPNISAIICLEKVDMVRFYEELEITKDTFTKLSYILAYAGEKDDIKKIKHSLGIVEKYINTAETYAKRFIDLAAIAVIEGSMVPYWEEYGVDVQKENGWSSNKEKIIGNLCTNLLKDPKWRNILLQELNMPSGKTSLILLTMEKVDFMPEFETLIPLLERDLFDMDILNYLLIDNPEYYLIDVMDYLKMVLPERVLIEDPQDIAEEEITSEYKPDIWLAYLLKALRREQDNQEALFISCLTSRFPDVRIEAIQALRVFKKDWSEAVLPALEKAYNLEPVKKIAKRFQRLLGKGDKQEKEQRYVEFSEIKVVPSPWDLCLISTKIAGTYYRDLLVMEGRIENGDILYLLREPDNPYDPKAILVTAEDGYVLGYVPRGDNAMIASMMDAGEKLYAIFRSYNLDKGKPDINIMLSKHPKSSGKVIEFPFNI